MTKNGEKKSERTIKFEIVLVLIFEFCRSLKKEILISCPNLSFTLS